MFKGSNVQRFKSSKVQKLNGAPGTGGTQYWRAFLTRDNFSLDGQRMEGASGAGFQ
jgi:hypothetical protein